MGRRREPIWLSDKERSRLQQIANAHESARVRQRARIVLLSEGAGIWNDPVDKQIAGELKVDRHTVGYWRREYGKGGLERITKDAGRPGRPRSLVQNSRRAIIEAAQAELESRGKPCSTRELAKLLRDKGISVSHTTVNQIVRRASIESATSTEA